MDKIRRILSEKAGISIVFVLCASVLLVTIGVSVLVAASTTAGTNADRRAYNQLRIYSESIFKTFTYSLKAADNVSDPEYLGLQLLEMVCFSKSDTSPYEIPEDFAFKLDFNSGLLPDGFTENPELKLSFESINVDITPYQPYEAIYIDGSVDPIIEIPERPKIAKVSFKMAAALTLELNEYTITDTATYEFTDGRLENSSNDDYGGLKVTKAGKWRLLSYEKADI